MMERVVTAVRWVQRAEARLSDSIIGDLIGYNAFYDKLGASLFVLFPYQHLL